jgi:hypothetical protein
LKLSAFVCTTRTRSRIIDPPQPNRAFAHFAFKVTDAPNDDQHKIESVLTPTSRNLLTRRRQPLRPRPKSAFYLELVDCFRSLNICAGKLRQKLNQILEPWKNIQKYQVELII